MIWRGRAGKQPWALMVRTGESGEESQVNWKWGRKVAVLWMGAMTCSSTGQDAGGSACGRREKTAQHAGGLCVEGCAVLASGAKRDLPNFAGGDTEIWLSAYRFYQPQKM